jgi:hypothetical protein
MRRLVLVVALVATCAWASPAAAQAEKAFLGKWDITATTPKGAYPLWLEVTSENGVVAGMFQDRTGSVRKIPEVAVEGGDLVFSMGAPKPGAFKPVHRAHIQGARLVGELTLAGDKVSWVGVRPPRWGNYNASAPQKLGPPVNLFNGKDTAGWRAQLADKDLGFAVADGVLTNEKTGNNLVSLQQFRDFALVMEYKLEKDSNSGLYLRGRYELQVLDDAGKEPNKTSHMSVYGRVAPAVNASKPAGEWQTTEVTLVGNRVTVVLNGKKVHDNVAIEGITGGALDSNEGNPGPIMIQGDHSRIWIRKLVVTPIRTGTAGN